MKRILPFILLFFATNVKAQTINDFVQIGVNNGLSQNSVHDVFQDKIGFLWFATADGLNRYDGINFKVYKHRYGDTSRKNIPADFIHGGLQEDKNECLWFYTDHNLVKFDKKANSFFKISTPFDNIDVPKNSGNASLMIVGDYVWTVGLNNQLYKIHTQTHIAERVRFKEEVKYYFFDIPNKKMFVQTKTGLHDFDFTNHQILATGIVDTVTSITMVDANRLAYISAMQVKLFNTQTNTSTTLSMDGGELFNQRRFYSQILSWKGRLLFVGIPGLGLLRYDIAEGKSLLYSNVPGDPGSLSINYLKKFFIDFSDNLWLGTEGGGLCKLDLKTKKFHSYPNAIYNVQNPVNLMIKSIYAEGSKIYAGTFSKGLHIIDTSTGKAKNIVYPDLVSHYGISSIMAMHNDSKNRLWMNVGPNVGYIHKETGKFIAFDTLHRNYPCIYSMYEYKPDTIILGSLKRLHRAVVLNNGKVKIDHDSVFNNPLIRGMIQAIVPNRKNEWYIGTIENGFRRCKIDGHKISVIDSGMSRTGVRHFYADPNNDWMWVASDNGLMIYNEITHKWKLFDEANGLSNSHVYAILPENNNTLWISTNKGINRIVFEPSDDGFVSIKNIQTFTQKNGLQSNEFNSGAYFIKNNRYMIFGGVTGINWFNTNTIVSNSYKPNVALTGLKANEEDISEGTSIHYLKNVKLPYYKNSISLSFAALEFTNSIANRYMYKLEGSDGSWVEGNNEIRFAGLTPGTYTLWVKASNNDSVWGEDTKLLRIHIQPPFWQTWWFKLLMFVITVLLIVWIVRSIVKNRVAKRVHELEMQQVLNEERNRISRDMHDEMGTGLTKISLLTEVARQSGVHAKDRMPQLLDDITKTSRGLTQKMGEIIWMLNPVNDTLDSLAVYLKEYVFNTTDSLEVDVVSDFPENIPSIKLNHDKRRQLLLVTKEALHNALKHAGATQLSFSLDIEANRFQFMLNDNGVGIQTTPQSVNGKHNGLKNMEWRMQQIGGFYTIDTEANMGTTIIYGVAF